MKELGINTEVLKDRILGHWSYRGGKIDISYEDSVKALFYVLIGSKDPKNIQWGSELLRKIVGEKIGYAKKLYDSLPKEIKPDKRELIELMKSGNYDRIIDILKEAGEKYMRMFGINKGLEAFMDILDAISGIKYGKLNGGKYIVAVVGKFPSLIFSYESTGSCSHLPALDDINKEYINGHASIAYLLDPRIILIGFSVTDRVSIDSVREKGKVDGVIMGGIFIDENRNTYLLIDSVEMGPKLFFPESNKWFNENWEEVYKLIIDYAKRLNVKYIIFNTQNLLNTAPKYFIIKLEEKYKFKEDEAYLKIIGPEEIPYVNWTNKHYLEAFNKYLESGGKVRGYIVKI